MDDFNRQYLQAISDQVTQHSGIGYWVLIGAVIAVVMGFGMGSGAINHDRYKEEGEIDNSSAIIFGLGLLLMIGSLMTGIIYFGPVSYYLTSVEQQKAISYTKKHPDSYKYKVDIGEKNLKALWSKPTEVYKTEFVNLVSTSTQDNNNIEGSINDRYLLMAGRVEGSIKSEDKTDYRYYVDLGDGKSQLRKLSDEYPDAEAKDIYIQELDHVDQPQLKIEHHRYRDKDVRNALKATNRMYMDEHPVEWITYTFEVPQGSVNNVSKLS
ncbi:hypothetical protein G7084_04395 [Weissella coleopterorum]|uniref:Uncharacterized protein n=1 Tax=Weissella coleopterorum TaxID=2714949 RepID=A0A6G8B035_9LACO|nr:hypothetical protein [Weissella coleopterorum]QIL50616.1 hypothetical protein G7084_04395 [Weissella coleopterorum]